jgi:hypothetical protein
MDASDWAAWVGAVTGVLALTWEVVKRFREGPRLKISTSASMMAVGGGHNQRPMLMVWVTNVGSMRSTLTTFSLHRFPNAWAKARFRPSQSWVVPHLNVGTLPHELAPGQQWVGAVEQREDTAAEINQGDLYVGIYDAFHRRPTLAKIIPPSPPRARGTQ